MFFFSVSDLFCTFFLNNKLGILMLLDYSPKTLFSESSSQWLFLLFITDFYIHLFFLISSLDFFVTITLYRSCFLILFYHLCCINVLPLDKRRKRKYFWRRNRSLATANYYQKNSPFSWQILVEEKANKRIHM